MNMRGFLQQILIRRKALFITYRKYVGNLPVVPVTYRHTAVIDLICSGDWRIMLLLDRLQEILIFHRKLDYNDEDATLEEQGEKILYFYSTTLDARDVKDQLTVATFAEALIELTNKFSKDPVQTVVMHRKFWALWNVNKEFG